MQVKKFEARTMKEALEMVKTQLGPDAIILSARDNNKSFGLVGEGSVEITAAVSEETLQKKKFAESRLREQDREKFLKSPARQQKELIHKMVEKHVQKNQPPAPITQRRYIDIEDEAEQRQRMMAEERVRSAAQRALNAFQEQDEIFSSKGTMTKKTPQQTAAPAPVVRGTPVNVQKDSTEIAALKNEIESLKQVISHFHQMPQNFVGTHPGADFGINYDLSFVFEKLTAAGMAREVAAEILTIAQDTLPALKLKNKPLVEAWVARHVLDNTRTVSNPTAGKIHCFVGPAGAGKTSALIKMASQMVVREGKKIALFTTDTFKVGAADQMKIYAQILNVPFSVIRSQNDWTSLMRYLPNVDCVLVDYTGMSLKNPDEIQMLKSLLPPAALNPNIHLVLSTNVKDADATELGRRYSGMNYKDVIFTSLDESTQHGTIYNFMKRFDIPLHSFGIGPRVPEDFEFATKERLLDLIFKITKFKQQDSEAI
ncbi:MAG: flagellar biosynthesis protein [Bdellovibrio sp. ArHS]|uniref:flagellar biosynthesis protein FlhF n=1 Tax=Bdellovibrio sp. ArHS TaxID=1569284 RepID=UPI00058387F3|nr:flagellar biosynthesis protein FlhF [Bdellovibrio sp. ArHS]KHD89131.1 MAG: flagellar biosynthesis protein [Bdellovibrio sp. ArHS]